MSSTALPSLQGLSYAQAIAGEPASLRGSNYADLAGAGAAANYDWLIGAAIFGQLSSAYAGFHSVQMGQIEAKSQASAQAFRGRMLAFDRRAAERQAESLLEQGQSEIANLTLAGGQRRAEIEAGNAARGIESGVGSAAEVQASERLIEQIDTYHINLASVRAANAARADAVATDNEALFARTSARNLRRSARYAHPEAALVGGIGSAALNTYALSQYRRS